MGKFLFWAVVIVGVLLVTRILAHQAAKQRATKNPSKNGSTPSIGKAEEMVRCKECGVYMPRSEAVKQGGEFWCSTEHAKTGSNS
jgi:uncharacterized protein